MWKLHLMFAGLAASLAGCMAEPEPASALRNTALHVAPGGGQYCDSQCVVKLFRKLARAYRPSGEEAALRAQIVALASNANADRWGGRLEIVGPFLDDPGAGVTKENFLIRVPATGTLAGRGLPPVALQAHMDMVLASTEVPPGGDLKAWFKSHPVALEEVDGWIQSVGQKSTIGADDTVGVAMQLRYALDPSIEHPPLELIFTAHEEVGLRGAAEWDRTKLPITAPVMVTLDGDDADKLIYGSQGSARRSLEGAAAVGPAPAGTRLIKVAMTKLLGGHSGLDIHRQRLNAVVALTALAKHALASGALGIESAVSGELGGINKIPNGLTLQLAVPGDFDAAGLRASLVTQAQALVVQAPGEASNTAVAIDVSEVAAPADGVTVLAPDDAARLIEIVLAMDTAAPPMNGVISTSSLYPNQVNTSSNLGYFELKKRPTSSTMALAFMERSFSATEQQATTARIIDHLKGAFGDPSSVQVTTISGYDPWLEDRNSPLIRLALGPDPRKPRFSRVSVQPVGLEPSYFKVKYPDLQIVGFSPTIVDYHTPRERLSVESVHQITRKLDAFLLDLAARPGTP